MGTGQICVIARTDHITQGPLDGQLSLEGRSGTAKAD